MFRRSFLFLMIALVLTSLLALYRYLGGFTEPDISFLEKEKYIITGYYYEGRISAGTWEELFYRMVNIARDSAEGDLAIIWYNQPEREKGFARAFIGIKHDGDAILPANMETREIEMQGVVRATLESHVLVMPNPEKIARRIRSYGEEHGYDLQEILIETYPEESVIHAEIPVKE
jgi:hypothetical protein